MIHYWLLSCDTFIASLSSYSLSTSNLACWVKTQHKRIRMSTDTLQNWKPDKLGLEMFRMMFHLTLFLYKNPKQRVCTWDSLEEVVIIINRKKIPVNISISNHNLHVGYVVDVKNKFVEVFKFPWFETIQRKSSKFCTKLQSRKKPDVSRCQSLIFKKQTLMFGAYPLKEHMICIIM